MSDIIQLLPDSVANQIAAGEVIQRPASVIKELVENALDAGASTIHIIVKDAGRTLLQVIDNGKGMSPTDARLAFERHATSKIRQAGDIFSLHTMGFRGEALASIAAIAQVELRTAQSDSKIGTMIKISASTVEQQECITAPQGCNIAVKNIFFNVPARRKFLKNNATELSYILTEFERIALINNDITFTVTSNDNELFNLSPAHFKQRIISLFGKTFNQQLLKVSADTSLIQISGYVGKPEAARKRNAQQYLFVNNRYMRHPYFHKAVVHCYEQLLPVGEMPNYFLHFTVDPNAIDINIHPTKTEIKFENEQPIWQIISAAVKEALGKFSAVPSIDFDMVDAPEIPIYGNTPPQTVQPPKTSYTPGYNPFNSANQRPIQDWNKLYEGFNSIHEMPEVEQPTPAPAPVEAQGVVIGSKFNNAHTPTILESHLDTLDIEPASVQGTLEGMVAKGSTQHLQFKGRYILTSVKSGMLMLDQHRAHVRILFDKYIAHIEQKQGVSQRLLFPEMIELSPSQAATLDMIESDLQALGFDISPLGASTYSINAIPTELSSSSTVELLHQLIDSAGSDLKADIHRQVALSLATASAIPYGQTLTQEEMEQLIDNLFACTMPNYTPDGKPTLSVMTAEELSKRFK